jgi:hypothetical protein
MDHRSSGDGGKAFNHKNLICDRAWYSKAILSKENSGSLVQLEGVEEIKNMIAKLEKITREPLPEGFITQQNADKAFKLARSPGKKISFDLEKYCIKHVTLKCFSCKIFFA